MIAICILGLGMLLIAAIFPVGIEQTRVATLDTMTPIIADEAFQTMSLLCREARLRPWPDPNGPGNVSFVLCEVLPKTANLADAGGRRDVTDAIYVGLNPVPTPAELKEAASLNDYLKAFRSYPSGKGQPGVYGWSVLFWSPPKSASDKTVDTSRIEFVFLVQRRSADRPMWIWVRGDADSKKLHITGDVRGKLANPQDITARLGAGPTLVVVSPDGLRVEVLSISNVDAAQSAVWLDEPFPFPAGQEIRLWAVPKDPASGVSPLIGTRPYVLALP